MTDSSSEPDMGEMAGQLMMAKMDANKLTHLLRIGTFQLEIAPNENIDVRAFFNETLDRLISAYGEKLLEIDVKGITMQSSTNMHG
jgi:hypothetical protein|tara:strand:+ start:243 stop:500 length:258 start_codon:yes stop_codon:yes gene_type:complete